MAYPTVVMHDCNVQPPTVDSFDCAPETSSGEFTEILIASKPLTTAEIADAEDFAARVTDTPSTDEHIVRIKVTGKWTETEPTVQEVEGDAEASDGIYKYAVELDQFHNSATAKEASRLLQYANKPSVIYLINAGNIFGGAEAAEDGIKATIRVLNFMDGKGTLRKRTFKFGWKARCAPKEVPFVLA